MKKNILYTGVCALALILNLSLSSYNFEVNNKIAWEHEDNFYVSASWATGKIEKVPFKNGKVTFSTPGIVCLDSLTVGKFSDPHYTFPGSGFKGQCASKSYKLYKTGIIAS